MKSVSVARKVGGSIVVTIPKDIVREENIREGETVLLDIEKAKKSGFGMFKGMRSFTKEDELDTHG